MDYNDYHFNDTIKNNKFRIDSETKLLKDSKEDLVQYIIKLQNDILYIKKSFNAIKLQYDSKRLNKFNFNNDELTTILVVLDNFIGGLKKENPEYGKIIEELCIKISKQLKRKRKDNEVSKKYW
jgi:hypothetical protein